MRPVRIDEKFFPASEWSINGSTQVCDAFEECCKPISSVSDEAHEHNSTDESMETDLSDEAVSHVV